MEFQEGEKVLCYHGPLLYEAKVLNSQRYTRDPPSGTPGQHFFVHYRGWKNTWDEWVHQDRMLHWNDTNLAIQKKLHAEHRAQTAKEHGKSKEKEPKEPHHREPPPVKERPVRKEPRPRKEKPSREEEIYGSEANWVPILNRKRGEIKLPVPELLKTLLVDDWEAVTKHGQLVPLPRTPCIDEVLLAFKDHLWSLPASGAPPNRDVNVNAYLLGIKTYFDKAVGANLLYRFERPQYAEMLRRYQMKDSTLPANWKTISQIYGAEHLLRLLVTLPAIMVSATMEQSPASIIRDYTLAFFEFLLKERDTYFVKDYENTSSEYLSIAMV